MLDVVLRNAIFRHDGGFTLGPLTHTFAHGTHTAVVGSPAGGATTLLRLVAGDLQPQDGDVILGQRRVNGIRTAKRPLLLASDAMDIPLRWSVQHALVAAVRTRSLDRIDRQQEHALAAEKWELVPLFERRISTLSATELARVQCARIELLRPAILVMDRLFDAVSPAARSALADRFHRTLRVHGTTVISAPASREELALVDAVIVLRNGSLVQSGPPAEVFARPADEVAAAAMGEVDEIPITIRGNEVDSVIGSWEIAAPPFQGSGIALVRPSDFAPAGPGEDSDLIFNVEEAGFAEGRWLARGFLTGGLTLRVELPAASRVHKGRLLALRYDPARFTLLPRDNETPSKPDRGGGVPPMSETR